MARTDVKWAGSLLSAERGANAGYALGPPDGDEWVCVTPESATFGDWRRATYDDLDFVLSSAIVGAVSSTQLQSADFIAWELNGPYAAPGGGWESCSWTFSDTVRSVTVDWVEGPAESTVRDPHVIATGSVNGAVYGELFKIPQNVILQYDPLLRPDLVYFSFLLIRLRDDVDVKRPEFTATLTGAPATSDGHRPSPDVDAMGVLLHAPDQPAERAKPRKSPARAVRDARERLGAQDVLLPTVGAMWQRLQAGFSPRNDTESKVYAAFNGLDQTQRQALERGLGLLTQLRDLRLDKKGLFDYAIADSLNASPLDPSKLSDRLAADIITPAVDTEHPHSGGSAKPGMARPWQPPADYSPTGEPVATTLPVGPWPWLTAIRESKAHIVDLGDVTSIIPPPGEQFFPTPQQLALDCQAAPADAFGPPRMICTPIHPVAPPQTTGMSFPIDPVCEGGPLYTYRGPGEISCMRIPEVSPGQTFQMRGFNFTSADLTVHLALTDDSPPLLYSTSVPVWGDQVEPVTDPQGAVIADLRVDDRVDVLVPLEHPEHPGQFLPSGLYHAWVTVVDTSDPAAPRTLDSNKLLIRVAGAEAAPVTLTSDTSHCHRKTSSFAFFDGDDEIWWSAGIAKGNVSPGTDPDHPFVVTLDPTATKVVHFPHWNDVDDGQTKTFSPPVVLFNSPLSAGDLVAVAIYGLEVDSEVLAREHITEFWDAFIDAFEKVLIAIGSAGIAGMSAAFAKAVGITASVSAALFVGAIVIRILQVTTALIALWSVWAPPEIVALDLFLLDPQIVRDLTNPRRPNPSDSTRVFGSDDEKITVTQRSAGPKRPGNTAVPYKWVNRYQAADPESDYELGLILNRAITG